MSQFGIFLNFIIYRDIESKKKSDKISPSHVNSIALVKEWLWKISTTH